MRVVFEARASSLCRVEVTSSCTAAAEEKGAKRILSLILDRFHYGTDVTTLCGLLMAPVLDPTLHPRQTDPKQYPSCSMSPNSQLPAQPSVSGARASTFCLLTPLTVGALQRVQAVKVGRHVADVDQRSALGQRLRMMGHAQCAGMVAGCSSCADSPWPQTPPRTSSALPLITAPQRAPAPAHHAQPTVAHGTITWHRTTTCLEVGLQGRSWVPELLSQS